MGQEFPSEGKLIVVFQMDYSNQQAIISNALLIRKENKNYLHF